MKCTMTHPFLNTNECKYFTLVEFSKAFQRDNISLSMLCNCRSLEAHWGVLPEVFCNLSSDCHKLDIIDLTEIFRIRDSQQYNINWYQCLLFNTRMQNDDGHGGVDMPHGLLTKTLHTLNAKISITFPLVFESMFYEVQDNINKPFRCRCSLSS